jgi:hypothetical protein
MKRENENIKLNKNGKKKCKFKNLKSLKDEQEQHRPNKKEQRNSTNGMRNKD